MFKTLKLFVIILFKNSLDPNLKSINMFELLNFLLVNSKTYKLAFKKAQSKKKIQKNRK